MNHRNKVRRLTLYAIFIVFDKARSVPLWNYEMADYVWTVAISSDGHYIVVGNEDNKVYLFVNTLPSKTQIIPEHNIFFLITLLSLTVV